MKTIQAYEDMNGDLHRSKREVVKSNLTHMLQICGANGNDMLAEWLIANRKEVGDLLRDIDAPEASPAAHACYNGWHGDGI